GGGGGEAASGPRRGPRAPAMLARPASPPHPRNARRPPDGGAGRFFWVGRAAHALPRYLTHERLSPYTPRAISPEEVTHVSETGRVRAGAGPRGGRGRVGGPGPGAEARREGAGRPVERHRLPHPGRDAHRVRP